MLQDFQLAGLRVPVLRVLDLYYKVAIFQLELEACTSHVGLALQRCDFRAGAGLRVPVLRVLNLHYKVAVFQLELEACTSHVGPVLQCYKVAIFELGLALQSCDFSTRARLLSDSSEHNF